MLASGPMKPAIGARAKSGLFWAVAAGVTVLSLWGFRRAFVLSVFDRGDALMEATGAWLKKEPAGGGGQGGAGSSLPGEPLFDWSLMLDLDRQSPEAVAPPAPSREGRDVPAETPSERTAVPSTDTTPGRLEGQSLQGGNGETPPGPMRRVPKNVVLEWANKRASPRGVVRAKTGGVPAGIELHGVGALGIGLREGDRLVAVEGQPALDRTAVVRAVLAARAEGRDFIVATVVRPRDGRADRYTIAIQQPYPEDLQGLEPSQNEDEPGPVPGEKSPGTNETRRYSPETGP